jgi:hypothetical protein
MPDSLNHLWRLIDGHDVVAIEGQRVGDPTGATTKIEHARSTADEATHDPEFRLRRKRRIRPDGRAVSRDVTSHTPKLAAPPTLAHIFARRGATSLAGADTRSCPSVREDGA